jgi:hypothetical protein
MCHRISLCGGFAVPYRLASMRYQPIMRLVRRALGNAFHVRGENLENRRLLVLKEVWFTFVNSRAQRELWRSKRHGHQRWTPRPCELKCVEGRFFYSPAKTLKDKLHRESHDGKEHPVMSQGHSDFVRAGGLGSGLGSVAAEGLRSFDYGLQEPKGHVAGNGWMDRSRAC